MRLGILKRKPVAISSRKKSADESKRTPKNVVENVSASAVSSEVHTTPLASLRPEISAYYRMDVYAVQARRYIK